MTDQNEVLSYEEQHSAYVKEVYEEVANAPIVETTEEQDKDEGSSDPETRSVSNTLVFVRETPGKIEIVSTRDSLFVWGGGIATKALVLYGSLHHNFITDNISETNRLVGKDFDTLSGSLLFVGCLLNKSG